VSEDPANDPPVKPVEESRPSTVRVVRPKTIGEAARPSLPEAAPVPAEILKAVAPAAEKAAVKKCAVLVAHGMGQQVAFETLQEVADAVLRRSASEQAKVTSLEVGFVKLGEHRLPRAELQLEEKGGISHEVHFYEAYWAPLTEGKVTTLETFQFLLGSALAGIRQSWSWISFERWMFEHWQPFPVHPTLLMAILLLAVLTLVSLSVINGAILAVTAATGLMTARGSWPSKNLQTDLSIDLALTEAALILLLGFALLLPMYLCKRREKKGELKTLPGWLQASARCLVFVSLFVVIVAGGYVFFHLGRHRDPAAPSFWVGSGWECSPNVVARVLLALVVVFLLAAWLGRNLEKLKEPLRHMGVPLGLFERSQRTGWYRKLALAAAVIVSLLLGLVAALVLLNPPLRNAWGEWLRTLARWVSPLAAVLDRPGVQSGVIWACAIAASYSVTSLLRQYVGDVAAYLTAHKVSKFADVRQAIQKESADVFRAVYEAQSTSKAPHEYEKIVVVGHSLGSVIAYDTLNLLLIEDEMAKHVNRVAARTRALVTFGSPLDKTAFIFRTQKSGYSEVREGLAAARQPMIVEYEYRPKEWINLWSREDWISGELNYYDDDRPLNQPDPKKKNGHTKRIMNLLDAEACVPLAAHTQYWGNRLLAEHLYRVIVS